MRETNVLLTGSTGFVGKKLVQLLDLPLLTPNSTEINILDINSISSYLKTNKPTSIIHLAAFTDVKAAECQRSDKSSPVWKINVEGTQNLLQASRNLGIHFVQISTDCVFPGNGQYKGPFSEDYLPIDDSNLMSWYAYTKLKAEEIIKQHLNSAIVRISFPFGGSDPNKDYVLKLIKTIELGYPLFSDQQFSPTFIKDLALSLEKIAQDHLTGNYHVVSADITNPFDFGRYLAKKIDLDYPVKEGSLQNISGPVINQYPKFGGLKSEKTQRKLGLNFHTSQDALEEYIASNPNIKSKS